MASPSATLGNFVLPSQFDCNLKIRDFGAGLTESEVENILVNYGLSHLADTLYISGQKIIDQSFNIFRQ